MGKFKVGDKVRVIEATHGWGLVVKGDEGVITKLPTPNSKVYIAEFPNQERWKGEEGCFELVEPKLTKNQRITALEEHSNSSDKRVETLEKEVAELKLIVHELRDKKVVPSTDVKDIIEFEGAKYRKVDRLAKHGDVIMYLKVGEDWSCITPNKPYNVYQAEGPKRLLFTRDSGIGCRVYDEASVLSSQGSKNINVYALITDGITTVEQPVAKTPNQQRAEIVEKAKKFVEEQKQEFYGSKMYQVGSSMCFSKFHVNKEKGVITCLLKHKYNGLMAKGIAKCNPSDVFNEHLGKAIALGRALGLDVSEFEQAVQPTEQEVGQILTFPEGDRWHQRHNYRIDGPTVKSGNLTVVFNEVEDLDYHVGEKAHGPFTKGIIINDTNAQYGGVE